MLKLAIIRPKFDDRGNIIGFTPVIEAEDGDIERELASRIRGILGPKESYTGAEVDHAVKQAFEDYKTDFKRQTIHLK